MGVRGLTTVLEQHGWIPSRKGCIAPLWRDDSFPIDRIERIPAGSTLAIDGNGLAHYLFDVAYSRHWENLGLVTERQNAGIDCSCPQELTQETIVQCLPQSVRLQILDQVVREFVHALSSSGMTLVAYWDGKLRRFKAATAKERRASRAEKYSHLRQYCQFGSLPFPKPCCRRNFQSSFPPSNLIVEQVRSTLQSITYIQHIQCTEEADAEVARASSESIGTYCVGMDSDFWLFRDTKYVPISTIRASTNLVTASVMTRDDVATLLHLPSSESIVELGILLGNDYIKKREALSQSFKNAEEAIEFLQYQSADFRVTATSTQVQLALDFTRALYSFACLDDFPTDPFTDDDEDDGNSDHPVLPASLDLSLVAMEPIEFSLRDVMLRPLQAYVDQTTDSNSAVISQLHLDIYIELNKALELNLDRRTPSDGASIHRPTWDDILASYAIERTLAHIFGRYAGAPVVRYSSPMKMFDALSFQNMMNAARKLPGEHAAALIPVAAAPKANGTSVKVKHGTAGPITYGTLVEAKDAKHVARVVETLKLPIDEFEEEILRTISNHRVTIIQGETGCGKSSRVPIMILRAPVPDDALSEVKMFISQPRRIAAKALVERVRSCEPDLQHKIALRMGHGEREYETTQTRAWFVTTGYLVRVLANHPERFNNVSHLIVDEVHERSVDSDVLCLLCKRLLTTNKTIRLVLMSATLAANMYADYFDVMEPPIKVGGRRFPIQEFFIEDLISKFKFPAKDQKTAKTIKDQCEKSRCKQEPSNHYMESLYQLAVRTTAAVGQPGSSVLIFVPGMHDIVSIIDLIEQLYVPGANYTCFPIHSDVPFEEQMAAFDTPAADEIKVIIGTNAAESSITLPDVDHVICLGLQKQIVYNPLTHRQLLTPAWISQASAIQRAGRTGRVRNGNVYRLYTRAAFEEYMAKFEVGEMSRMPLDSVILDLKQILHEETTPVLLECLEPPELRTIERSFESLHEQKFLSTPDDSGDITNLGSFVASLGIDLLLGSLIGIGIQFGVGAEAIEIAAILSFSKSPWIMSNPLFHESPEFNDLTSKTFTSRCHFDANLYSDPLAIMNLIWEYERAAHNGKFGWKFSLAMARVKRLVATRNSIRSRVAQFIGGDHSRFAVQVPPFLMPHSKVVLLRIVLVWVLHDNLIQSFQVATVSDDSVMITLRKNLIKDEQLKQVLDETRHPYLLVTNQETEQKGTFTRSNRGEDFVSFLVAFEDRFISYCAESDFKMAWYRVDSEVFVLLIADVVAKSSSFIHMKEDVLAGFDESYATATANIGSNHRGRNGRPCGLWKVEHMEHRNENPQNDDKCLFFVRLTTDRKEKIKELAKFLKIKSLQTAHVEKTLSCHFFAPTFGKKKGDVSPGFSLFVRGQGNQVSRLDAMDLFLTTELEMSSRESERPTQEVRFKIVPSLPLGTIKNGTMLSGAVGASSSWTRPLLNDIPEGARVLSVVASNRRPDHYINFSASESEDDKLIKVEMSRTESRIGERWTSFPNCKSVFVDVNCVPAASLSMDGPIEVFAVAGDSLELKGGRLRVSGLTLLPPGRLFLLLCMKTFGLHPEKTWFGDEDAELDQCLVWLQKARGKVSLGNIALDEMVDRIVSAINFHESCGDLGENLVCYPEFVVKLLSIFDQVDGYPCAPWEGLFAPTTGREEDKKSSTTKHAKSMNAAPTPNVAKSPNPAATGVDLSAASVGAARISKTGNEGVTILTKSKKKKTKEKASATTKSKDTTQLPDGIHPTSPPQKNATEGVYLTRFNRKARKLSATLFSWKTDHPDAVDQSDLPSTNVLSCLADYYSQEVRHATVDAPLHDAVVVPPQWAIFVEIAEATRTKDEPISLSPDQWRVFRVQGKNGMDWYSAAFVGSSVPLLPLEGRGVVKSWMKDEVVKPTKSEDAMSCVPPNVAGRLTHWTARLTNNESKQETMILFPDMETAVRMAAAYWLERQFYDGRRHWYQLELNDMKQKLKELALKY